MGTVGKALETRLANIRERTEKTLDELFGILATYPSGPYSPARSSLRYLVAGMQRTSATRH